MSDETLTPYGLLLTLDGYGACSDACDDPLLLLRVLRELPPLIGMRVLGNPHIVSINEPSIAGLSGFTFIYESHISIHTYSERRFMTADIYSCKQFDVEIAKKFLSSAFQISDAETSVIRRGIRFHDQPLIPVSRPP